MVLLTQLVGHLTMKHSGSSFWLPPCCTNNDGGVGWGSLRTKQTETTISLERWTSFSFKFCLEISNASIGDDPLRGTWLDNHRLGNQMGSCLVSSVELRPLFKLLQVRIKDLHKTLMTLPAGFNTAFQPWRTKRGDRTKDAMWRIANRGPFFCLTVTYFSQ